ncbi:hypothetical protein [Pseudomonas viridiflava]|uniref:hypothetical protein n=1 Tax=Pseudomonas viridiflava TaxID=33069 RepID=UPI0013CEA83B|nr:hypothetical protein [Pseudomonas viridiflava]
MYKKIPEAEGLGVFSLDEILSKLKNSNFFKFSQERTRVGSLLSDGEVQSLREEMIRDGAYMKEWLRSKPKK